MLEREERDRQYNVPPMNAFEEAIKWTEEGILRTLPANNELGGSEWLRYYMDYERNAP